MHDLLPAAISVWNGKPKDLKLTLPNHHIKLRRHLARGLISLFRALNIRFGRTHHAEFDVVQQGFGEP